MCNDDGRYEYRAIGSDDRLTDQYDRLEDLRVHDAPDELTIQLRPREGQRLDTSQLQACVDYTIAAATQDPD